MITKKIVPQICSCKRQGFRGSLIQVLCFFSLSCPLLHGSVWNKIHRLSCVAMPCKSFSLWATVYHMAQFVWQKRTRPHMRWVPWQPSSCARWIKVKSCWALPKLICSDLQYQQLTSKAQITMPLVLFSSVHLRFDLSHAIVQVRWWHVDSVVYTKALLKCILRESHRSHPLQTVCT